RYLSLRPLRVDNDPSFPLPADQYGDVRNMPGPSLNDSIWIDLGYPVQTMPDGRKYKALFAFLVRDLDSLINLNVHGHALAASPTHRSNQGWGPWEVNPQYVLNANPATEWSQLLVGNGTLNGRYGPNKVPGNPGAAPLPSALLPASFLPAYAGIDYNAQTDPSTGNASFKFDMPGQDNASSGTQNPVYAAFPRYTSAGGWFTGNYSTSSELTSHPSIYDY